ncbi:MAG: hypothetical protein JF616_06560 [Fibrobacteres bacterium]|jgi:hypothetical protein|nr:hypothetical protein [Fibrobacterota bacterium]
MQKKYLGLLLIVTGAFVLGIACLKRGYSPGSPLFANFLLGSGVFAQGVSYMLQGGSASAGSGSRRKGMALVFVIYYIGVVAWMLARR